MYKVEYARPEDGDEVIRILEENDQGLAVELTEHLVLKNDDTVLAVAAVMPVEESDYLSVIASDHKGNGDGGRLLKYITGSGRPVTTIARGTAAGFYRKFGFIECTAEEIDENFRDQCCDCPEVEECRPVYMKYGGEK